MLHRAIFGSIERFFGVLIELTLTLTLALTLTSLEAYALRRDVVSAGCRLTPREELELLRLYLPRSPEPQLQPQLQPEPQPKPKP